MPYTARQRRLLQPVPSLTDHYLYQPIRECQHCPLVQGCAGPAPPVGHPDAQIMMVGEAPGEMEDEWGVPFTGATWEELEQYLKLVGLGRGAVWLTNLVKCRPIGDPVLADAATCAPLWLETEIKAIKPKLIVAMGQMATRYLLGDPTITVEESHGFAVWDTTRNCYILPVYHPAAGFYTPRLIQHIRDDFMAIAEWREGRIRHKAVDQLEGEEVYVDMAGASNDAVEWVVNEAVDHGLVALDTETEPIDRKLWCLSITYAAGLSFVFDAYQLPMLRPILEGGDIDLILHNALYDVPRLLEAGVTVRPGMMHDTMLMARNLQKDSIGLKPLTRRIAGMKHTSYTEVIGKAQIPLSVTYLQQALVIAASPTYPPPPAYTTAEWDKVGHRLVAKTHHPQPLSRKIIKLLTDIADGKVDADGDLIDPLKRWRSWGGERNGVIGEIGDMPQAYLAHIPRPRAAWYSARDADATYRIFRPLLREVIAHGLLQVYEDVDAPVIPMISDMMLAGITVDTPYMYALTTKIERLKGGLEGEMWAGVGHSFNPASNDQVAYVLFDELGLDKGRITKGGKASTEDKVLMPLKSLSPVVANILDWRMLDKAEDSYTVPLPQRVDVNSRVHCDYGGMTVTGRLEAKDPNLMAIPMRTSLGKEVRSGLTAAPGKLLLARDYDQVEMRVMAHASDATTMIDIFTSGQDIHKMTAAMAFNVAVAMVNEEQRYAAKRVGFGVVYDITEFGLLEQMKEYGLTWWTLDTCRDAIDRWNHTHPAVPEYKRKQKTMAMRTGMVHDMWGRRRMIPEVYSSREYIKNDGLRIAVNSPIQMGAQGIIKKAMATIWRQIEDGREWRAGGPIRQWRWGLVQPLLQIHDELLFEIVTEAMAEMNQEIGAIMEGVVRLKVPIITSYKQGFRMGELEKVDQEVSG